MAGADVNLNGVLDSCDGVVYVLDNEPRNTQITKRIADHISRGHKVVIWPNNLKEKDINDMYLAGHDVQQLVQLHTYQNLTAQLKFKDWAK